MVQTRSIHKKQIEIMRFINIESHKLCSYNDSVYDKRRVISCIILYNYILENIDFISSDNAMFYSLKNIIYNKKTELLEQLYTKMNINDTLFTTYDMKALKILQDSRFNKLLT